ncbi:MAG: pantoate--beta-alanine ligase [Chitinophagales bacterium]
MILFKNVKALQQHLADFKSGTGNLGWVPTMGALHAGHISLLNAARSKCRWVICSIFVNPTQFNDRNDFRNYPITLDKDISLLEENGVDLLFLPGMNEIYPDGTERLEKYNLGKLESILEGQYRPGHFQGVCQVLHRLGDILKPDHLFMGQKDFQQCMVVKRLLEITHSGITLHTCSTLREPDGLAMSSRNMRLNETQRKNAIAIYEALNFLKKNLKKGSLVELIEKAKDILSSRDFRTDYVAIADPATLETCKNWDGQQALVGLIAAFQQEIRLIDNMVLAGNIY